MPSTCRVLGCTFYASGSGRRVTAIETVGGFCMQAQVKVVTVYRDNDEVNYAKPGENLRIRISGVEEEDIIPGFVLSSVSKCGTP